MIEWISQAEMLVKFEEALKKPGNVQAMKEHGTLREDVQAHARMVIECLDQWPYEDGCILIVVGNPNHAVLFDISDELGEEMVYFDITVGIRACNVQLEKVEGEESSGHNNRVDIYDLDFRSKVQAHLMRGVQALKDLKG